MGNVETSPRPKKRPSDTTVETSLRPKKRPSEEEIADRRIGRIIERSNEIKKLIDIEAEGLFDKTPLVPIREPTGEPVKGTSKKKFRSRSQDGSKEGTQQFTLGGDVRHNPNRGKTY